MHFNAGINKFESNTQKCVLAGGIGNRYALEKMVKKDIMVDLIYFSLYNNNLAVFIYL